MGDAQPLRLEWRASWSEVAEAVMSDAKLEELAAASLQDPLDPRWLAEVRLACEEAAHSRELTSDSGSIAKEVDDLAHDVIDGGLRGRGQLDQIVDMADSLADVRFLLGLQVQRTLRGRRHALTVEALADRILEVLGRQAAVSLSCDDSPTRSQPSATHLELRASTLHELTNAANAVRFLPISQTVNHDPAGAMSIEVLDQLVNWCFAVTSCEWSIGDFREVIHRSLSSWTATVPGIRDAQEVLSNSLASATEIEGCIRAFERLSSGTDRLVLFGKLAGLSDRHIGSYLEISILEATERKTEAFDKLFEALANSRRQRDAQTIAPLVQHIYFRLGRDLLERREIAELLSLVSTQPTRSSRDPLPSSSTRPRDFRASDVDDVFAGDICVVEPMESNGDARHLLVVLDSDHDWCRGMLASSETELATEVDAIIGPADSALSYDIVVHSRYHGKIWSAQVRKRVGAVADETLHALESLRLSDDASDVQLRSGIALQPEGIEPRYAALRSLSQDLDALTSHYRQRSTFPIPVVLDPLLAHADVLPYVLRETRFGVQVRRARGSREFGQALLGTLPLLSLDEQYAAISLVNCSIHVVGVSEGQPEVLSEIEGHRGADILPRSLSEHVGVESRMTLLTHHRCWNRTVPEALALETPSRSIHVDCRVLEGAVLQDAI